MFGPLTIFSSWIQAACCSLNSCCEQSASERSSAMSAVTSRSRWMCRLTESVRLNGTLLAVFVSDGVLCVSPAGWASFTDQSRDSCRAARARPAQKDGI